MTIHVLQHDLNTALKNLKGIIPHKPMMSILESVLIQTDIQNNTIKLTVTNIAATDSAIIPARIHSNEDYSLALPYRILLELTPLLNDCRLSIGWDELTHTACIADTGKGSSETRLIGHDPADFPRQRTVNDLPQDTITLAAISPEQVTELYAAIAHTRHYGEFTYLQFPGNRHCLRIITRENSTGYLATAYPIIGTQNAANIYADTQDLYNLIAGLRKTENVVEIRYSAENGQLYFINGEALSQLACETSKLELNTKNYLIHGTITRNEKLEYDKIAANLATRKKDRERKRLTVCFTTNPRWDSMLDLFIDGHRLATLSPHSPDELLPHLSWEITQQNLKDMQRSLKFRTVSRGKNKGDIAVNVSIVRLFNAYAICLWDDTSTNREYFVITPPKPQTPPKMPHNVDTRAELMEAANYTLTETELCIEIPQDRKTLEYASGITIFYELVGNSLLRGVIRNGKKAYTHKLASPFGYTHDRTDFRAKFAEFAAKQLDGIAIDQHQIEGANNAVIWQKIDDKKPYELAFGVTIARLEFNGQEYRYSPDYTGDNWQPLPDQINAVWRKLDNHAYKLGMGYGLESIATDGNRQNIDQYRQSQHASTQATIAQLADTSANCDLIHHMGLDELNNTLTYRDRGHIVQFNFNGVWLGIPWHRVRFGERTKPDSDGYYLYQTILDKEHEQSDKAIYEILCAFLRNGGELTVFNFRRASKNSEMTLNASHIGNRLKLAKIGRIMVKFPKARKFSTLDGGVLDLFRFGSLDDTAPIAPVTINYSKKHLDKPGWHWITLNTDNPIIEDTLTRNGAKFSQKRGAHYYIGDTLPEEIAALAETAQGDNEPTTPAIAASTDQPAIDNEPTTPADNAPAPQFATFDRVATVASVVMAQDAHTDNEPEQITQPVTGSDSIPVTIDTDDTDDTDDEHGHTIPVKTAQTAQDKPRKPARKTIASGTLSQLAIAAAQATARGILSRARFGGFTPPQINLKRRFAGLATHRGKTEKREQQTDDSTGGDRPPTSTNTSTDHPATIDHPATNPVPEQITQPATRPRWINATDTGKLIRQVLKAAFIGVTFRVYKSKSGNHINIDWQDGPTQAEVTAVIDEYGFDGVHNGLDHWGEPIQSTSHGTHPDSGEAVQYGASIWYGRTYSYDFVVTFLRDFTERENYQCYPSIEKTYKGGWMPNHRAEYPPRETEMQNTAIHIVYKKIIKGLATTSAYTAPDTDPTPPDDGGNESHSATDSPTGETVNGVIVTVEKISEDKPGWTWLQFPGKPSAEIRAVLKNNGGRWAKKRKQWFFKSETLPAAVAAMLGEYSPDEVTASAPAQPAPVAPQSDALTPHIIDPDTIPARFEIITDRADYTHTVHKFDFASNDVTKLLRGILADTFPGVTFSVRKSKSTYSYGHYVTWTDGPTTKEVETIVKFFTSTSFDGMTDSSDYVYIKDLETGTVYDFSGWEYPSAERHLTDEARAIIADLMTSDATLNELTYVKNADGTRANYANDDESRRNRARWYVSFAPMSVPTPPDTPQGDPDKLRSAADTLRQKAQKHMDSAANLSQLNTTHRRTGMIEGAYRKADRANDLAALVETIADHIEAGTLPPILAGLTSRAAIETLYGHRHYPDRLPRNDKDRARLKRAGFNDSNIGDAIAALLALADAASETDPDEANRRKLEQLERDAQTMNLPGFFVTPDTVLDMMFARANLAGLQDGDVLEPSAGSGAIADRIRQHGIEPVVIEWSVTLQEILKAKGYTLSGDDCLTHEGLYQCILMNPPFENAQDAEHVMKLFNENLAPGGRLISIMSAGATFNQRYDDFNEWLEDLDAHIIELPAGSFKTSGTGVNAVMVIIDKSDDKPTTPDDGGDESHRATDDHKIIDWGDIAGDSFYDDDPLSELIHEMTDQPTTDPAPAPDEPDDQPAPIFLRYTHDHPASGYDRTWHPAGVVAVVDMDIYAEFQRDDMHIYPVRVKGMGDAVRLWETHHCVEITGDEYDAAPAWQPHPVPDYIRQTIQTSSTHYDAIIHDKQRHAVQTDLGTAIITPYDHRHIEITIEEPVTLNRVDYLVGGIIHFNPDTEEYRYSDNTYRAVRRKGSDEWTRGERGATDATRPVIKDALKPVIMDWIERNFDHATTASWQQDENRVAGALAFIEHTRQQLDATEQFYLHVLDKVTHRQHLTDDERRTLDSVSSWRLHMRTR